MTIKELIYLQPIEVDPTDANDIEKKARDAMTSAFVHNLKPGNYDITDYRWNNQIVRWRLTVLTDGTGVLSLTPDVPWAGVFITGTHEEGTNTRGVVQVINNPDDPSQLIGEQKLQDGTVAYLLFKSVIYERS
ncbi:hypothetical protein A2Z33_02605 [Candidatus Gottesmanbacteria bacterium RBG_16_52_11]|uniref:Uncharacterized protein n=1 Tax=Candidatus Gottesmanbacteria bacterium RBG_16_52_11 TaxID=1798374 RepID=A0A1F5YMN3_9BACT|nr:MAG: hypothetical protein A2Z33_02605 [Candidatus Gottesmanbacteria bacterium RBG_16_52_11]